MKNIYYSLFILVIVTSLFGCDDYDPAVTPPSSVSFVSDDVLVSFLPEEPVYPLTVYSTTTSSQDRTVNIILLEGDDEDGVPYDTSLTGDYSIESMSVVIPAGEISGSTNMTFDSNMLLGEERYVSFMIDPFEDYVLNNSSNMIKVNYTPACPYNSIVVDIVQDRWGSETTWSIEDSSGGTVASGGPFSNLSANGILALPSENYCLEDGDYTFYINDSYGDGMVSGTFVGSFKVSTASGAVLGEGVGDSFFSQTSFEFTLPVE